MEEPVTPWLIAEATAASGLSLRWAWAITALGAVVILVGGLLICVM